MDNTQNIIVYRSKWNQQIDEYKPEIMMGIGAIILLLFFGHDASRLVAGAQGSQASTKTPK